MYVRFERPDHPTAEHLAAELPIPPREGDWVSLGDADEQYLVRTVIWHTYAVDGGDPWVQVILKD